MGCIPSKRQSKAPRRYLVDKSYFVSQLDVAAQRSGKFVHPTQSSMDALASVWVSKGMPPDRPPLTDLTKRIVRESWGHLRLRMVNVGSLLFLNLADAVPAIQALFNKSFEDDTAMAEATQRQTKGHKKGPSRDQSRDQSANVSTDVQPPATGQRTARKSLQRATVLRAHVEKIMATLDTVIKDINNQEAMERVMHDVGDRHAARNMRVEYLDLFIPFFISAIRPVLDAKWIGVIEDAWAEFLWYCLHLMKEAIIL